MLSLGENFSLLARSLARTTNSQLKILTARPYFPPSEEASEPLLPLFQMPFHSALVSGRVFQKST